LIIALSVFLTFAIMLPLSPYMPHDGLDPSWSDALNEAVANRLVFGKDLIFTLGPLSSVYTWYYHPATDHLMLIGSAIVTIGLCCGFGLLTTGRRPRLLLVLPFMVAFVQSRDAVFMSLPLCLLVSSFMLSAPEGDPLKLPLTKGTIFLFALLACAIGILPIIKGSLYVIAVVIGALSVLVLIRARLTFVALGMITLVLISLCVAWMWTGQPLADLPGYFASQSAIISGYTDAMAIPGPLSSVFCWAVPSVACLAVFYLVLGHKRRLDGIIALTGVAAYLFMTFKAGFVRQDGHPAISVAGLVVVGYVLSTMLRPKIGVAMVIVSLCGWFAVMSPIAEIKPKIVYNGFNGAMKASLHGVEARLHRGTLFARYNDARMQIRDRFPLPQSNVTVDLYPTDLSRVFASKLTWSGRPILQSYAAYTPELTAINREHLKSDGASRIFFAVAAIDEHYPATEDGLSWPEIISRYQPTGFVDEYAVLDKRSNPSPVAFSQPFISGVRTVGQFVPIPQQGVPVWAQINIKPTVLGKLVSALFKIPLLHITVKYPDKTTISYRLIPGMVREGFVLSPTVTNAQEFVALQSGDAKKFLQGKYPIDFAISGDAGTSWFWNKTFDLRLSMLSIPPDTRTDRVMADLESTGHESQDSLTPGGDCSIDTVNMVAANLPVQNNQELLTINGWAAVSANEGIKNEGVELAFTSPDGNVRLWSTHPVMRLDVANVFKRSGLRNAGFQAIIDSSLLNGSYKVSVVQKYGAQHLQCAAKPVDITR
jgi:hypothetical protein